MSPVVGIDLSCLEASPETGVERYARCLVEHLGPASEGLLPIALLRPQSALPEVTDPVRVEVVRSPLPRVAWRETSLMGALDRLGVRALHAPVAAIPMRCRLPMAVTIHDVPGNDGPEAPGRLSTHRLRLKVALGRAARLIVPSQATADAILALRPDASDRLRVIPHGVDSDFRPAGPPLDRLRYGVPEGRYLLFVGTVRPRKDPATLIAAFERIADEPDCQDLALVLAGQLQMDATELLASMTSDSARERVIFTDYFPRPDLPNLYRSASVVVIPSHLEGFGLPALEAMAVGCPLVTSDDAALRALVGEAGLHFAPGDDAGLAARLIDLLRVSAKRKALAEEGQRRAAAFSWAGSAAKHADVYRELLSLG